jgi:3-oxoacyl-[acyl-carrier protein] reductase
MLSPVCPTWVFTEIKAKWDTLVKMAPLERLGEPEDIANAVVFLAGSDAAWINGQVLRANGGVI